MNIHINKVYQVSIKNLTFYIVLLLYVIQLTQISDFWGTCGVGDPFRLASEDANSLHNQLDSFGPRVPMLENWHTKLSERWFAATTVASSPSSSNLSLSCNICLVVFELQLKPFMYLGYDKIFVTPTFLKRKWPNILLSEGDRFGTDPIRNTLEFQIGKISNIACLFCSIIIRNT